MPDERRTKEKAEDAAPARLAYLEAEIARHQVVQQDLVRAKLRVDLELQRFEAIQAYVSRAALFQSQEDLYRITVETLAEAFEFQATCIARLNQSATCFEIVSAVGFDEDIVGQPMTLNWLASIGQTTSILRTGDQNLPIIAGMVFHDAIVCPFQDKDGSVKGVIVGGRIGNMSEFFEPVGEDIRSAVQVMVSQFEALLINKEFSTDIQRHNKELQALSRSFSRFVPFEFLQLLNRNSITDVSPADSIGLEMTVLFVDLRGFTSLSETIGSERAFGLLNEYFGIMRPEISANGGFINHYQGDGLMALFDREPDAALDAVVGMVGALEGLNASKQNAGEAELTIGIGINFGHLMLGALGDEQRLDGNVIGDTVNLASRVQDLSKLYNCRCIVTENTVKTLTMPDRFTLRELDRVIVRGRKSASTLYELLDAEPPGIRPLKAASAETFSKGLKHYRNREFAEAIGAFAACLSQCERDIPAKLYVARCAEFLQKPPEASWDGTSNIS